MKNPTAVLFLVIAVSASVLVPEHGFGQAFPAPRERHRDWTSAQGSEFRSRLIAVNETSVKLASRDVIRIIPIASLNEEYQQVAKSLMPDLGHVSPYPMEGATEEQQRFLEEHSAQSLVWEGTKHPIWRRGTEEGRLPFLFFEAPNLRTGEKAPLIIHLHGTGGFGTNNLDALFTCGNGIAKSYLERRLQGTSPCNVLVPQVTRDSTWFNEPAKQALACVVYQMLQDPDSPIDPKRVYLIGLSLGGMGVTHLMAQYPDLFAAGIAVAEFESTLAFRKNSRSARDDNFWIVVNRKDTPSTESRAENFMREYRELGGSARLTLLDGGGHDAWTDFLGRYRYRTWLFRKELQGW